MCTEDRRGAEHERAVGTTPTGRLLRPPASTYYRTRRCTPSSSTHRTASHAAARTAPGMIARGTSHGTTGSGRSYSRSCGAYWRQGGGTAAGRPVLEALAAALGRRIVVHGGNSRGGVLWEVGRGALLEVLLHERHYYAVVPMA